MKLRKTKVLISGHLHVKKSELDKRIQTASIIEKAITKSGYKFHDHLLCNKNVYAGTSPDPDEISIDGRTFTEVMNSFSYQKLKTYQDRREYENEDKLKRCLTVRKFIDDQLPRTCAAIVIMTWESPGSQFIIGRLIESQTPVLCVSNKNNFGTNITGEPERFVLTRRYRNLDHLYDIVVEFLDLVKKNKLAAINRSIRIPNSLNRELENYIQDNNINFSKWVSDMIEEKIGVENG